MNYTQLYDCEYNVNLLEQIINYSDFNYHSNNFTPITTFRFRPGYSKLWRRARTTLRKLYGIKSEFQHLLTRHLNKIYKYSSAHRILLNHYTLENILISIDLAKNKLNVREIIEMGFILINFKAITFERGSYQLYVNDIIQVNINWFWHVWLINILQTTTNTTNKYVLKWINELKKPYKNSRNKILFKVYHQLYLAFKDVYKDKNKFISLFEVDYSLGWIYTLRTPLYWWETNVLSLTHEPLFDAKVYNWKYIT